MDRWIDRQWINRAIDSFDWFVQAYLIHDDGLDTSQSMYPTTLLYPARNSERLFKESSTLLNLKPDLSLNPNASWMDPDFFLTHCSKSSEVLVFANDMGRNHARHNHVTGCAQHRQIGRGVQESSCGCQLKLTCGLNASFLTSLNPNPTQSLRAEEKQDPKRFPAPPLRRVRSQLLLHSWHSLL